MILSDKTLENLREMINEKTEYRSGPKIVEFFNSLGFSDVYSRNGGFPSRWAYTDEKLKKINGGPELDKCIKAVFSPSNFIGRFDDLSSCVQEFNQYMEFDGWKVQIKNKGVEIHRCDGPDIESKLKKHSDNNEENDFLNIDFSDVEIDKLPIEESLKPIISNRIIEIQNCIKAHANIASIILIGSVLEGVLLGLALNNQKLFNTCSSAPKHDGKTKLFPNWTLSEFIDVAYALGFFKEDVRKFSHVLRDFRNYIHPYQQLSSHFSPDEHTVNICYQVLRAGLYQINNN